MRIILWKVWDFLTQRSYRVKIDTFDDGSIIYRPQRRVRIFPVWLGFTDADPWGVFDIKYHQEKYAIDFIQYQKDKIKAKRLVNVRYKKQ